MVIFVQGLPGGGEGGAVVAVGAEELDEPVAVRDGGVEGVASEVGGWGDRFAVEGCARGIGVGSFFVRVGEEEVVGGCFYSASGGDGGGQEGEG